MLHRVGFRVTTTLVRAHEEMGASYYDIVLLCIHVQTLPYKPLSAPSQAIIHCT